MSEEKINDPPWFWRIFGGAIIGLMSVLLISHFANINNHIDRTFIDLRNEIKDCRFIIDNLKEKSSFFEQSKERIDYLEKKISLLEHSDIEIKTKLNTAEAVLSSLKDEKKDLEKQIQEIREKLASVNSGKKP